MTRETAFDQVFDSQAAFRALLDAMSRPGSVQRLPVVPTSPPPGFNGNALTILRTLCDNRVTVGVASPAGADAEAWCEYVALNVGSPLAPSSDAGYVVFDGAALHPDFATLGLGDPEYPEHGATAIVQVRALGGEAGADALSLELSGPGVDGSRTLSVAGLHRDYLTARDRACSEYPLGIDMLLVGPAGRVTALPRSTTIQLAGAAAAPAVP